MTAETKPNTSTTAPHHHGNTLMMSRVTRIMPYMAVFSITPLMRADILEGATGCASGSHTCKGIMPAFAAKPKNERKKAAVAHSTGNCDARIASKVYPLKSLKSVASPAITPNDSRIATAPMCAMTR